MSTDSTFIFLMLLFTGEFNACAMYGNNVCANGQCIPSGRSYRCSCNPGYVPSKDGTVCLGTLYSVYQLLSLI